MELLRMRRVLPLVFLVMLGTHGGRCDHELHSAESPASGANTNTTDDTHTEYNQIKNIREFFQLLRGFVDRMLCVVKKQVYSANDIQHEQHLTLNDEENAAKKKNLVGLDNTSSECYQIGVILYDTVNAAKIALSFFEDYKNNFAVDTFSKTWAEVLAVFGDTDFGIPPSIPPVPDKVDLKVEMVRVYGQLQHHLVGLENVTLDQISFSGIDAVRETNDLNTEVYFYLDKFTKTISYIEELLGYTRKGMKELEVGPDQALTQELTRQAYQDLDTVLKGGRDFIILKKYEEGLQYIIAVFTQAFSEICMNVSFALKRHSGANMPSGSSLPDRSKQTVGTPL